MTKKVTTTSKKPVKAAPAVTSEPVILPKLTNMRVDFDDKPLTLSREAILLNYRAFDTVKAHPKPMRRGLTILGIIIIALILFRGLELLLGYLTTPRFDIVSTNVLDRVTALDWYVAQSGANPEFANTFNLAYDSVWQLIRIVGGYPSPVGTAVSLVWTIITLLLSWLLYGAVAHLFARWFGGKAGYKEFLGPLALSYAPLLLLGLEFLPGFALTALLVPLMMLITKYLAVRETYALSEGYSAVVVLAPFVVGIALVSVLAILGIGLGLGQIPFLDPILRFFTF